MRGFFQAKGGGTGASQAIPEEADDAPDEAGGPFRAYVETVSVEATNGVIKVTFTPKAENPQINGIEILPQP